jgi:hypothetical protein
MSVVISDIFSPSPLLCNDAVISFTWGVNSKRVRGEPGGTPAKIEVKALFIEPMLLRRTERG